MGEDNKSEFYTKQEDMRNKITSFRKAQAQHKATVTKLEEALKDRDEEITEVNEDILTISQELEKKDKELS